MGTTEFNDGLKPPAIETVVDEDGICRTTVYRYSQVVSEQRKAAILAEMPNAVFSTRLRVSARPAENGLLVIREMFTEITVALVAEFVA